MNFFNVSVVRCCVTDGLALFILHIERSGVAGIEATSSASLGIKGNLVIDQVRRDVVEADGRLLVVLLLHRVRLSDATEEIDESTDKVNTITERRVFQHFSHDLDELVEVNLLARYQLKVLRNLQQLYLIQIIDQVDLVYTKEQSMRQLFAKILLTGIFTEQVLHIDIVFFAVLIREHGVFVATSFLRLLWDRDAIFIIVLFMVLVVRAALRVQGEITTRCRDESIGCHMLNDVTHDSLMNLILLLVHIEAGLGFLRLWGRGRLSLRCHFLMIAVTKCDIN